MRKSQYQFLAFLLLAPAIVFADGVSPVLNFFHKDTWIPASIVTLVIILLESALLRWRIKGMPFTGVLWRSFLFNAASSLTGSVLLIVFSKDSFVMWDSMSFVFPLFLITLLTEIPLLHVLFKNVPLSWKRAVILGSGINVASYAAVFIIEIGLLVGWLSYARHLDQKELTKWNNPDLLKQASGLIYATELFRSKHGLRVYDPLQPEWTTLTNCPSLDPNKWDVEGETCAFIQLTEGDWKNVRLVVAQLPDFKTVLDLSPTQFANAAFDNWQGVEELAVSPDQTKLAILFRQTDAVAAKNRSSYFDLGGKCKLIILDILSGQEIARASRWASKSGLCWLADSRRVLFPSLDDESLYRTTMAEVHGSTSYGIGYARDDRFKQGLYVFDIESGETARFADDGAPSLAVETGAILVQDQSGLVLLNSAGEIQEQIKDSRVGFRGAVVSPSGEMILAEVWRHSPFLFGGRLILYHKTAPELRHMLDDGFAYRFDWTRIGD